METIRVDGSNGLRFSARRKGGNGGGGGTLVGGSTTGSPYVIGSSSAGGGGGGNNGSISDRSTCSSLVHANNRSSVSAAHGVSNTAAWNAQAGFNSSHTSAALVPAGINPNKAVFTIDSRTSRILIVNYNACTMLGYTSRELRDMLFADLLATGKSKQMPQHQLQQQQQPQPQQYMQSNRSHVSALAEGQLNSDDGTMVLLSGKVVEMNTKQPGVRVAVSLWIRQIDPDGRCLAVAEPVERRVAQLLIDRNGAILSAGGDAVLLFQLDGGSEQFAGMDVQQLIPAIVLPDADSSQIPKHIRKQKATGRTADGVMFPLCLMLALHTAEPSGPEQGGGGGGEGGGAGDSTSGSVPTAASTSSSSVGAASTSAGSASTVESGDSGVSNSSAVFTLTVWVFQNLSGLLVMDDRGVIESCNHHFSMLMFGYAQVKILGRHISDVIPHFGEDVEYVPPGLPEYLDAAERSQMAAGSSLEDVNDEEVGMVEDGDDLQIDGYESDETETDPVYYENEAFVMSEGGRLATGAVAVPLLTASTSAAIVLPKNSADGCDSFIGNGDEILVKTRSEPVNIAREVFAERDTPMCRRSMCKEQQQQQRSATENSKCGAERQCPDMLRTPVNETTTADGRRIGGVSADSRPQTPAAAANVASQQIEQGRQPTQRAYQLSDISDALRAVDASMVPDDCIVDGATTNSPKFNPQQTEAGV